MICNFNETPRGKQLDFRTFAESVISPKSASMDESAILSKDLLNAVGKRGYLGALIEKKYDGMELDMLSFGWLNEEIGRVCSSIRSLITTHAMVGYSIQRWGSEQQREAYLPLLAKGELLVGFAMSEAKVGSDISSIEATADIKGKNYILNGGKNWITGGQLADLFLVFAQSKRGPVALLVDRESAGVNVSPIRNSLGFKASMSANVLFSECEVPTGRLIGREGFGLSAIAASALDMGRYSISWGCLGIIEEAIKLCVSHVSRRSQFGKLLKDHQLVGGMIANMVTNASATRLLCEQAARLREAHHPDSILSTCVAKYFASARCSEVTRDAVQLHGAAGCSEGHPVQRQFRDAKIMEIIEGSSQIQQMLIAGFAFASSKCADAEALQT